MNKLIFLDSIVIRIIILGICLFFLCIGILIPVPSPFEKEEQPKLKSTRGVPVPVSKVLIDLNGDDEAEWYLITPFEEEEE